MYAPALDHAVPLCGKNSYCAPATTSQHEARKRARDDPIPTSPTHDDCYRRARAFKRARKPNLVAGVPGPARLVPTGAPLLPRQEAEHVAAVLRSMWRARPNIAHNPAPNPVSLDRRDLSKLARHSYVVAEKTDGVRYALVLCRSSDGSRQLAVMVDRALHCYDVSPTLFMPEPERGCARVALHINRVRCGNLPEASAADSFYAGTLLDGELVWEPASGEAPSRQTVDTTEAYDPCNPGIDSAPTLGAQPTTVPTPVPVDEYDPARPALGPGDAVASVSAHQNVRLLFAVFDSPMVAGQSLDGWDYGKRMALVRSLVDAQGRTTTSLLSMQIVPSVDAFSVDPRLAVCARTKVETALRIDMNAKRYYPAPSIDEAWAATCAARHATDGLLFTRADDVRIHSGSSWDQFKWKRHHTVDLALRGRVICAAQSRDAPAQWDLGLHYVSADFTVSRARSQQRDMPAVATEGNACEGFRHDGRLVVFRVCPNEALSRLLAAVVRRGGDSFGCIAEFGIEMGPSGDHVTCTFQRVRTDKSEPNNRWTIDRTLSNAREAVSYEELREAVLRCRT